jgi:dihydroorotase
MNNILIKNGRIIDPANKFDQIADLRIEDGKIAELGQNLAAGNAVVIDATGLLVTPGLIDMHVHLRDPGLEYKEDIISGTAAAAAGGVTSLACMPNTRPVIDNLAVCRYIIAKAKEQGTANVFPIGSITQGLKGEILSEMGELKEGGCVAFSDDGRPVVSSELMRRALEYSDTFGAPVISHAEDLTGGHIHLAHVSTRGSVDLVRQGKARGVRVTCEAAPHHFTLTDEAVRGYNTNAKMNPPLRAQADVDAVRTGLADGTIDAIATDHAPHHRDEKNLEFALAANGIIGLETLLPLTLKLVEDKVIDLNRAVALMSCQPARILDIERGTLSLGAVADVTLIDPHLAWEVVPQQLRSKSKNTPFGGWKMKGGAIKTLLAGKIVFER